MSTMLMSELRDKLHGREYGHEMDGIDEEELKRNNIVIVFGYSDDNVEFRGAIDDEIGCGEKTIIYLDDNGILTNKCDSGDDCPYFKEVLKHSNKRIECIWNQDGYSWIYEPINITYMEFDIMENGEKYCRGIIFHLR